MTEAAKKMMEKWGWSKGQGLGKDNTGMKTHLVMKKITGSSSQARIEQAAATIEAGDAKRQKLSKVDEFAIVPVSAVSGGNNSYDIDPRDPSVAAETARNVAEANKGGYGIGLNGMPVQRRVRVRQWVIEDWRWSKGTEALRTFEEVQLPTQLLTLAKKILGEGSRYPDRIADDTDCVVEVTAWNTLLVRPRGTGARMELAKRMLYEVLHPHAHELREEALISPEEMARIATEKDRDNTMEMEGYDDDATRRMTEGLKRGRHGQLNRVGIGAEPEVEAEAEVPEAAAVLNKPEVKEMELDTADDVALVRCHMEDLRIATGVIPVVTGMTVRLSGKDKAINKAVALLKTLLDTGEWVALKEGFLASSGDKEKKRGDGPSEQILIKIIEGPVVQKIEKLLKPMERASVADQLKLTSKPVNGKRTLMVQGTKAAHERVKLMVKELLETGESPMLTKELGVAKSRRQAAVEAARRVNINVGTQPLIHPPERSLFQVKASSLAGGSTSANGVITAAPQLKVATDSVSHKPAALPTVGQGMRRLPPPKLAVAMAAGEDLFANLPSAGACGSSAKPEAKEEVKAEVKTEVKAEVKTEVIGEIQVKEEDEEKDPVDWSKVQEWDPATGQMKQSEANSASVAPLFGPPASAPPQAFPPLPPSGGAAVAVAAKSGSAAFPPLPTIGSAFAEVILDADDDAPIVE